MRTGRPALSSREAPFGVPPGAPLWMPRVAGVRRGTQADLDALCDFEHRTWVNRMSRRSLQRLLASQSVDVVVAQEDGGIRGVAILLYRANSRIARLYSIAVDPAYTGRGIAGSLLARAEIIARSHGCLSLRLEVHEKNHGAIKVYCRAGYHVFGRHVRYYEDSGDALRFEKRLMR
jgi:[ribosomal protein S18]-alanine N-acetyltransferase